MKRLFLLIGLVVFLTPMVVSSDESGLLNYHCIKQETVQVVGDGYEWRNISESCDTKKLTGIDSLFNSPLVIKNNKASFFGAAGKLKDNRFNINTTLGNLSGIIEGNNALMKFTSTKKRKEL